MRALQPGNRKLVSKAGLLQAAFQQLHKRGRLFWRLPVLRHWP